MYVGSEGQCSENRVTKDEGLQNRRLRATWAMLNQCKDSNGQILLEKHLLIHWKLYFAIYIRQIEKTSFSISSAKYFAILIRFSVVGDFKQTVDAFLHCSNVWTKSKDRAYLDN